MTQPPHPTLLMPSPANTQPPLLHTTPTTQVLGFIISAIMQTYSKRYLDGHMWLRCSHQGPMVRGVCLRMKVYCAYVRTRQMVWPWWSRPQGFWEVALAVLPRLPWAGRKKVNVFFFHFSFQSTSGRSPHLSPFHWSWMVESRRLPHQKATAAQMPCGKNTSGCLRRVITEFILNICALEVYSLWHCYSCFP